MPNEIIFPKPNGQRYYKHHYSYVQGIFQHNECTMYYQPIPEIEETVFFCYVNDKKIIFDFSDSGDAYNRDSDCPVFKFHYRAEHQKYRKAYPFAPQSFHNWNDYYSLREKINYSTNSDIVLNNQRAYAGATERRKEVQGILKSKYGKSLDVSITNQNEYWLKINDCLVAVLVCGWCNNMLDRSHMQLFAFGCPIITTGIPEILPFGHTYQPYKSYIMMRDDFSDLIGAIEWVRSFREDAKRIGNSAAVIFEKSSTPTVLMNWILEKI